MKLASATYTPIPFWLSIPVCEIRRWVVSANGNAEERMKKMEEARSQKRTR